MSCLGNAKTFLENSIQEDYKKFEEKIQKAKVNISNSEQLYKEIERLTSGSIWTGGRLSTSLVNAANVQQG